MSEQEAIEILRRAKASAYNKRTWRMDLNIAWSQGNYRHFGFWDMANSLQAVRNQFGPCWLARVSLKERRAA